MRLSPNYYGLSGAPDQGSNYFRWSFTHKLPLLQFVAQSFIRNLQASCGFLAIPAGFFENPQDDFLLSHFCGVAGHFLQRDVAGMNRHNLFLVVTSQLGSDVGVRKNKVALNDIFKLPHVTRPVVSEEGLD